jgi:hypothetical protein
VKELEETAERLSDKIESFSWVSVSLHDVIDATNEISNVGHVFKYQ